MDKRRLDRLRANAARPEFDEGIALLRKEAEEASRITYTIRMNEQGQWTHYYYCHEDGTRLSFEWHSPFSHQCPTCGKERTGEPFNSAWTSIAHTQIGRAVYHIALLTAIEPDVKRIGMVKSYLTAYADCYESYQTHGDIPYNGPGKLFAQTLDEAHWIMDLALGFDLIRGHLTPAEEAHIRGGLLEPCARFLILHKEKQIHNHAVLITSAIAAIGLLLDDQAIVQAGLAGEYGLEDQLARGVYEDGLWYEGNVQYHFYAFQSLLHYALIAEGTPWEVWSNKALKAMFDYPLHLVLPSGAMPTLNDAGLGDSIGTYTRYYEIAFDVYGDQIYKELLLTAYGTEWADPRFSGVRTVRRDSVYALLFGRELEPLTEQVQEQEQVPRQEQAPASASDSGRLALWETTHRTQSFPASGLTKLVNGAGWQAILKHSRFGGEHDHMDRLGLSVVCGSTPLLVDPGTTAYGIPAHYGWFKHTYSHNTVSISGADQPPRDGRLVQLVRQPWGAWAETAVDWSGDDFYMKDAIILPKELSPWDVEAYAGVQIRRVNVLAEDHMLDIVSVTVPEPRDVHLCTHISGELRSDAAASWTRTEERLSRLDQKWLRDKRRLAAGERVFRYELREGELAQLIWCSQPSDMYAALTPDNPPSGNRTSLIQRAAAERAVLFIQALHYEPASGDSRSGAPSKLLVEELGGDAYRIELTKPGGRLRYDLDLSRAEAGLIRE
ncbi:heparinase II/III family protein [Paenibacillus sp. GCM10023248]|uniref:heparinase II/III domain-containing protein n=1 Tax=unclassified Paenibacillus TaxID=185978 RepID=UPI0023782B7C|nr:heparinase II/III family protein [Paenibacillus sp. MAHUQ-63]MDD9266386.1 heparinase II/III family protein [Paenibacillus sp. MAHUQ-63]